jgi:hypothetical protein
MRWMAPAHGIWVPKCEGHQAFTSKMGAIRYADYHDRPSTEDMQRLLREVRLVPRAVITRISRRATANAHIIFKVFEKTRVYQ